MITILNLPCLKRKSLMKINTMVWIWLKNYWNMQQNECWEIQKHLIRIKFLEFARPWKRYRQVEAVQQFTGVDPLRWKSKEQKMT